MMLLVYTLISRCNGNNDNTTNTNNSFVCEGAPMLYSGESLNGDHTNPPHPHHRPFNTYVLLCKSS